jgi:hypothetical protein
MNRRIPAKPWLLAIIACSGVFEGVALAHDPMALVVPGLLAVVFCFFLNVGVKKKVLGYLSPDLETISWKGIVLVCFAECLFLLFSLYLAMALSSAISSPGLWQIGGLGILLYLLMAHIPNRLLIRRHRAKTTAPRLWTKTLVISVTYLLMVALIGPLLFWFFFDLYPFLPF